VGDAAAEVAPNQMAYEFAAGCIDWQTLRPSYSLYEAHDKLRWRDPEDDDDCGDSPYKQALENLSSLGDPVLTELIQDYHAAREYG
jgi:hypothetical protein